MGMYTEFVCALKIKNNTPKEVINILDFMSNGNEKIKAEELILPNHDLFECSRWVYMFRSDSYYFNGVTNTIFKRDETFGYYYLTIRTNLKNYDGEIEKFLDWIKPYIECYGNEFLGYSRYEEFEEPDLIYYDDI